MRHLKDVSRRFKNGFRYVMSCLYLICGKSLNFLSSMIAREPQRQREPRRQRLDRFISVVFCLCIPLFTTCKYMFYVMQASYISYSLAKKSVSASLQSTIGCQTKIADYLLTSFATYAMSRISSIVGAWLFGSLEMPDSSALGHPTALNQRTQNTYHRHPPRINLCYQSQTICSDIPPLCSPLPQINDHPRSFISDSETFGSEDGDHSHFHHPNLAKDVS